MLAVALALLIVLVVVAIAILISERQKAALQGSTLEAIRDLFKAMSQVNDYAMKKMTDAHNRAEEVKQMVQEVVPLVAESSGFSIPSGGSKSKESKP
jgi:HAMP domain-containing protein